MRAKPIIERTEKVVNELRVQQPNAQASASGLQATRGIRVRSSERRALWRRQPVCRAAHESKATEKHTQQHGEASVRAAAQCARIGQRLAGDYLMGVGA